MKFITAPILCSMLAMSVQAQQSPLTASEYQPSLVETQTIFTIQGMEQQNQPVSAEIEYLRKILRDNPKETVIHRIYQDIMRRDSLDALREEYKKLAAENPDDAVYAYLNGRIATTAEDRWRWAARAIRNDPNYYWGHLLMGYHFLNLTPTPDVHKAEEELLRAVEIDNSIDAGFVNLASLYRAQRDTAKVIEMFHLASICQPDNFNYIMQQVNLMPTADVDKAIAYVSDFLESHPNHEDAIGALRYLDYVKGDYDKALVYAQKAMTFGTPGAEQWYDLGSAYAMANQPDSAFAALNRAIGLGWNDAQYMDDDADMKSLHEDARWMQAKQKIQSELDRTAPDRRKEALMGVQNIPAPDFTFADMNGDTVSLKDYRGKVVVIDFWALWCQWCLKAMPLVEKFWEENKGNDVVVLSLNIRENRRKDVPAFIQKSGYTFRVLYGDDKVYNDYGIRGIPHMVVIDKDGFIRYTNIGYSPRLDETLTWQVNSLLN
jgi:thiol-disulfide isomerase/thioredoxin